MEPQILSHWLLPAARADGFSGVPANDTGIIPTIRYIKNYQADFLVNQHVAWLGAELPNLCGGYPQNNNHEHIIDGFYIAAMLILFLGSSGLAAVGYRRGHFFWPLLLIMIYCLITAIGYILRYQFSFDLSRIPMGTGSIVLIQFAEYLLVWCTIVFADRVCHWFLPQLVWYLNPFTFVYGLGFLSFLLSIIGLVLPYYRFMSQPALNSMHGILMAGSVLEAICALSPCVVIFVFAVYGQRFRFWDVEYKTGNCVIQADWITGSSVFYYPIPIHRPVHGRQHSELIRVIPTREPPYHGQIKIVSKPMLPSSPSIVFAASIVLASSMVLATAPVVRCLSNHFTNSERSQYIKSTEPLRMGFSYFPQSPPAMWVFFGGVQMAVLVCWLLLRVDLRFYIPPIYFRDSNTHPGWQSFYEKVA